MNNRCLRTECSRK